MAESLQSRSIRLHYQAEKSRSSRGSLKIAEEEEASERARAEELIASLVDLGVDSTEIAIARQRIDMAEEWLSEDLMRSLTEPGWRAKEAQAAAEQARFEAAIEGAKLESAADLRAVLAKLEPKKSAATVIVAKPKRMYVRREPAPAKAQARKPARRKGKRR